MHYDHLLLSFVYCCCFQQSRGKRIDPFFPSHSCPWLLLPPASVFINNTEANRRHQFVTLGTAQDRRNKLTLTSKLLARAHAYNTKCKECGIKMVRFVKRIIYYENVMRDFDEMENEKRKTHNSHTKLEKERVWAQEIGSSISFQVVLLLLISILEKPGEKRNQV